MLREENPPTVSGNVNGYIHEGEHYGGFFKKLSIEVPSDSAISYMSRHRLKKTQKFKRYFPIDVEKDKRNER